MHKKDLSVKILPYIQAGIFKMPTNKLYFEQPPISLQPHDFYVHKKDGHWFVAFRVNDKNPDELVTIRLNNTNLITLLESDEKELLNEFIIKSLLQIKTQSQQAPFKFDYAEHYDIGQSVKDLLSQHFPQHPLFKEGRVKLTNHLELEISEFYALMGDFFGLPDQAVSSGITLDQQIEIFQNAFKTLDATDPKKIKDILVIGAIQKQALTMAKQNCKCHPKSSCECAKKALEDVSSITNKLWNKATGGAFYLYPIFQGDYLKLSKNNVDHFSQSARAAYQAGHELANKLIKEIELESRKKIQEEGKIERLTNQVLAIEASAGHFLTDAFSSGHVRVPRKELYELKTLLGIPVPSAITGLFTLVMHNEDGNNGLWVTDQLTGDVWKAYGDDSLLTGKGKDNRIKVCAAARIGMLEIIGQLKQVQGINTQNETFPTWGTVYKLFPDQCHNLNLNQPLFKVDNGQLLRRKNVKDLHCKEYISNWWIGTTFLLLLPQIFAYLFSSSSDQASAVDDTLHIESHRITTNDLTPAIYKEQIQEVKTMIDLDFPEESKDSPVLMMQRLNKNIPELTSVLNTYEEEDVIVDTNALEIEKLPSYPNDVKEQTPSGLRCQ